MVVIISVIDHIGVFIIVICFAIDGERREFFVNPVALDAIRVAFIDIKLP